MRSWIWLLPVVAVLWGCEKKRNAPDGFQLEPGFTLQLVASEPLIRDPVDLEFNDEGEAYVLEMPGYPLEDKQSRILVIRDTDADGVYDESIVFAENLQMASSILPWRDGVLVAAPPYLLHARDINNDRMADAVDTLMGGFSTGNLQHNFNGLTYGLDNWIYAANGGNSGKPYWWNYGEKPLDLRGEDFRFDLETRRLERVGESSGGFGVAMDEAGHQFGTHNLTHVSQIVFSDRYWSDVVLPITNTLHNISDHEEHGLSRIYPIGEQETRVNHPEQSGYFSGSCGITYYNGGAMGPEYDQSLWVADVVLNLLHVDKLTPSGAAMSAGRITPKREVLASMNRSFRPVNMTVGPDGALYVIDMYRQVIEHPEWIPDDIEKTLDLEAGKDKGRIYRLVRDGFPAPAFDFRKLSDLQGLLESLRHPNGWVRLQAQRKLIGAPFSSELAAGLMSAAEGAHSLARIHAMRAMEGRKILTASVLLKALTDTSAIVNEQALLMSESQLTDPQVLRACAALLANKQSRVRLQALLSASTIDAATWNTSRLWMDSLFIKGLDFDGDQWLTAAAAIYCKRDPVGYFLKVKQLGGDHTELLSALARNASGQADGLATVLHHLAGVDKGKVLKVLQALRQAPLPRTTSPAVVQSIVELESGADLPSLSAITGLRVSLGLPVSEAFKKASRDALRATVDTQRSAEDRMAQLRLLEQADLRDKADVLFVCLDQQQPVQLQEAALRQLAAYDDVTIGRRLVEKWKSLGPQTRRLAGDLLLYKEVHQDALLTGLENGTINIGEMNFDLERRRTLLWWTSDESIRKRAAKLFSDAGVVTRQTAIDQMRTALTLTGDGRNGKKVFANICSNCHQYGDLGKRVGPVLTEINRKSKETLMQDILDPNAAVNTEFISHRLETTGGQIHVGIIASETDGQVTLRKMGGEEVTVPRDEIRSLTSLGTSLMMEGLEGSMTPQELADLLAFLQQGE